jgi:hypothetical protein
MLSYVSIHFSFPKNLNSSLRVKHLSPPSQGTPVSPKSSPNSPNDVPILSFHISFLPHILVHKKISVTSFRLYLKTKFAHVFALSINLVVVIVIFSW